MYSQIYYVHTHTHMYIYFFFWQLNASITISNFDLLNYKSKKRFIKRFRLPSPPTHTHTHTFSPFPLLAKAVGKQFSHSWKFVCHRHTMKNRRAHEVKFIFSIKSNRRTTKAHKCQRSVRWQRPDRLPQLAPASHQATKPPSQPPSYLATSLTRRSCRRLCCASSSVWEAEWQNASTLSPADCRRAQGNVFHSTFGLTSATATAPYRWYTHTYLQLYPHM